MMNEKVYVPLFDFQTLFDTDFGIISLMGAEYLDSGVFNKEWFQHHNTNKELLKVLYERVDSNPLVQTSSESKESIDELYKSCFEDKDTYIKILHKSMTTELYRLFWGFQKNGDIYPYILYKCKEELEFMKSVEAMNSLQDDRFISIEDFIMKPKEYRFLLQFYIKYIDDIVADSVMSFLKESRDGIYRTVYIADYNFNSNTDDMNRRVVKLTEDVSSILTLNHSVRTIDVYNRSKLED